MELTKSLVKSVTKYYKKKYEVFEVERNRSKSSLQEQMFVELQRRPDIEEVDLAQTLEIASVRSISYRVLKTRVRDRLINTLLQVDVRTLGRSERMRAEQEAMRLMRCSRLLIGLGMRSAGIQIAHKAIRLTRNFNLSLLHLMCLKILRYHYSYVGDRKAFNRYTGELKHVTELVNAELSVDNALQSMRFEFSSEVNASDEVRRQALAYAKEAGNLLSTVQSFDLELNTYRLSALAMQANGDYKQTISICDKAIDFLHQQHARFHNNSFLQEFELKRLVCLFSLRRYAEGLASGRRCLELLGKKRANFLLIFEPILLMHLHLGQFEQAYRIYETVTKDPRFRLAIDAHRMRWNIFEAYLHAAVEFNWLQAPSAWRSTRFNIDQFLADVDPLVRNRGGLNITIQIVLMLFYIRRFQETDKLNTLNEAKQQFIIRRLRGNSHRRSALFLRMLLSVGTYSFDHAKIVHKNRDRLKELQQINLNSDTGVHLEIIPYELLWSRVLEYIKRS